MCGKIFSKIGEGSVVCTRTDISTLKVIIWTIVIIIIIIIIITVFLWSALAMQRRTILFRFGFFFSFTNNLTPYNSETAADFGTKFLTQY